MTSDTRISQNDEAVEALLEQALPRPAPPPQAADDVRAAVRAEWAAASGQHRRRRATRYIAMAATVLVAAVFAFGHLQQTAVPMIEVAKLDQSVGTVHFRANQVALEEHEDASLIVAGQILQTGKDSAAGLDWLSGGSLRVDARTRIEFVAANEILLHRGRVYFDSFDTVHNHDFIIRTEHGVVSHVGTQYMTEVADRRLIVSVREGEVLVEATNHRQSINQGQRAEITGSRRPSMTNTSGVGPNWAWTEAVAPNISVDDKSAYDFLQWVSRETGYSLEFSTPAIEKLTREKTFRGSVETDPRDALRMRMLTMDLDARFDEERAVIKISNRE